MPYGYSPWGTPGFDEQDVPLDVPETDPTGEAEYRQRLIEARARMKAFEEEFASGEPSELQLPEYERYGTPLPETSAWKNATPAQRRQMETREAQRAGQQKLRGRMTLGADVLTGLGQIINRKSQRKKGDRQEPLTPFSHTRDLRQTQEAERRQDEARHEQDYKRRLDEFRMKATMERRDDPVRNAFAREAAESAFREPRAPVARPETEQEKYEGRFRAQQKFGVPLTGSPEARAAGGTAARVQQLRAMQGEPGWEQMNEDEKLDVTSRILGGAPPNSREEYIFQSAFDKAIQNFSEVDEALEIATQAVEGMQRATRPPEKAPALPPRGRQPLDFGPGTPGEGGGQRIGARLPRGDQMAGGGAYPPAQPLNPQVSYAAKGYHAMKANRPQEAEAMRQEFIRKYGIDPETLPPEE